MNPQVFSYDSMGTHWEIQVWDPISPSRIEELKKKIIAMSSLFDETYSRFIKTSFISSLADQKGEISVPEDFVPMLRFYEALYLPSEKKLTPLIGFTISDLGYDADYSLTPKDMIREPSDFQKVVHIIDEETINLKEPALFDFGALGKGYFVDKIATFLREEEVKHFLVNGSGDTYYESEGIPIHIGLEDPLNFGKVIGKLSITKGAVCASAGNRRKWREFHHLIDPHTLSSPKEIIASWVWSPTTALADGLATALFFVDPKNFMKDFQFEYCLLDNKNRVKQSSGFTAELFTDSL